MPEAITRSAIENLVQGGDGNGDGQADAQQTGVASMGATAGRSVEPEAVLASNLTIEIVAPATCSQLNDSHGFSAQNYPPDSARVPNGAPWGMVSFALTDCAQVTVNVTFHGATFDDDWAWRNYGPRIPGDAQSFGWYTFSGAQRLDADTWRLTIDASQQGNYRHDANNILFVGGPAELPDQTIFRDGFEDDATPTRY